LMRMVAAGLRAGSSRTRPDVKRPVSLGDWVVEVVIGGRMVDVVEIVGLVVVEVEVVLLVKFAVLGPLAGARQLTSRESGAVGQEPPRTARTKAATLLLPLELKASTLPYRKLTNHARDGLETLDVDDQ
jgi:hypothetical protein